MSKQQAPSNIAVEFNPLKYTKPVLAMILAKAEQWDVKPSIAEARLLDELVRRQKEMSAA